jgi:flagellar assembly factor FliW
MIKLAITIGGDEQTLRISETDVIHFPEGLVGCPDWRRFALLDVKEDGQLHVLQCIDAPAVTIIVSDPHILLSDYQSPLSRSDVQFLSLGDPAEAVVLCTLTYWEHLGYATANLLGPLVINPKARLGRQIVLADSSYSARHPVSGERA